MHPGQPVLVRAARPGRPRQASTPLLRAAPAAAAGTIADAAGQSFRLNEPSILNARERLVQLWQYRIDAVRHGGDPAELSGFDAWFANGIDEAWSLEQLHDTLGLVPDLDLGVHVSRRLHTLTARHPHACLRIVGHSLGTANGTGTSHATTQSSAPSSARQPPRAGPPRTLGGSSAHSPPMASTSATPSTATSRSVTAARRPTVGRITDELKPERYTRGPGSTPPLINTRP